MLDLALPMPMEGWIEKEPIARARNFALRAARSAKREQLRALAPPPKGRRGGRGGGGEGMRPRSAKREKLRALAGALGE